MEELQAVEHVCRKDPGVIEQCRLSGIPAADMAKVYCDPWTIGYDERHGAAVRLQQALMYYRPDVDACQYQYPLDFCPLYDAAAEAIVAIDVPAVRRPLRLRAAPPVNYTPAHVAEREGGYRTDLKPIAITQPEGVSFTVKGREVAWQSWRFHIGFNYREGIVLNVSTPPSDDGCRPPMSNVVAARISRTTTRAPSGPSSTGCRWRRWWCRMATPSTHTRGSMLLIWESTVLAT